MSSLRVSNVSTTAYPMVTATVTSVQTGAIPKRPVLADAYEQLRVFLQKPLSTSPVLDSGDLSAMLRTPEFHRAFRRAIQSEMSAAESCFRFPAPTTMITAMNTSTPTVSSTTTRPTPILQVTPPTSAENPVGNKGPRRELDMSQYVHIRDIEGYIKACVNSIVHQGPRCPDPHEQTIHNLVDQITNVGVHDSETCNIIEKWPKFSGDTSPMPVDDFLRQIAQHSRSYQISAAELRVHAHLLFKDDAYVWFCAYDEQLDTWEKLVIYLRMRYDNPNRDRFIKDQMKARKQRPNEKFSAYLTDIEALSQRLVNKMTVQEKFSLIVENMKMSYQRRLALHMGSITSIGHLALLCYKFDSLETNLYNAKAAGVNQIELEDEFELLEPRNETEVEEDSAAVRSVDLVFAEDFFAEEDCTVCFQIIPMEGDSLIDPPEEDESLEMPTIEIPESHLQQPYSKQSANFRLQPKEN
ncbi:hypothetical protein pipiens_011338 [Culex pipiens pipiens]|uniref:Retrotransposon gag domain-containing protein n=1 Tax=Culex pipiens pipiens TaxID=38569 RepID=A0ABD1D6Q1_CULPP